jgi:hypothetical protein
MRWSLVGLLVTGCGITDTADVATTVVNVHLTPTCATDGTDPYNCYESIELYPFCGDTIPFLEAETREVTAVSSHDPDDITGIVQLQYTGAVSVEDSYRAHIDEILTGNASSSVWPAYTDYVDPPLYKIDGEGRATEIDLTKFVGHTDSTLHFEYRGVLEDHTVNPPRRINVVTEDPPPCCSVGGPKELGIVLVLLLLPRRRRRR